MVNIKAIICHVVKWFYKSRQTQWKMVFEVCGWIILTSTEKDSTAKQKEDKTFFLPAEKDSECDAT